jgi:hypothetical protein
VRNNASQCNRVVPYPQLTTDLNAGAAPPFLWVTPNTIFDGHDGNYQQSDTFLQGLVTQVRASSWWTAGSRLIITWDEGEDSANSVLTLVVQPNPGALRSARSYNHYSLLATIEDKLGVARLGLAAQATPMTDLLPS